jgi:hypothetical protein
MSLSMHPNKPTRKEAINNFDERIATLEACVFAAMFMLEEHSGKETPISFALWQNFEHLKDSYQTLKQANAA